MKTRKLIYATAAFVLLSLTVLAQCDQRIFIKDAKRELDPYQLETLVTRPLAYLGESSDLVEAEFLAYEKEEYKIVNLCKGFSDDIVFEIFDPENNLVWSNTSEKNANAHSFIAEHDGNYIIQFKISPKDQGSADACIAFAIGYAL